MGGDDGEGTRDIRGDNLLMKRREKKKRIEK